MSDGSGFLGREYSWIINSQPNGSWREREREEKRGRIWRKEGGEEEGEERGGREGFRCMCDCMRIGWSRGKAELETGNQ